MASITAWQKKMFISFMFSSNMPNQLEHSNWSTATGLSSSSSAASELRDRRFERPSVSFFATFSFLGLKLYKFLPGLSFSPCSIRRKFAKHFKCFFLPSMRTKILAKSVMNLRSERRQTYVVSLFSLAQGDD